MNINLKQKESRVKKSLLNARVNLIFYFLTLALAFFSRKIFLDGLGADFIGLTSTLGNLLAFLNLAESGVSAAIAVVLYAPLFEHNEQKIKEIVSVMGYLYHTIGKIILSGGLLLACFFPLIFPDAELGLPIIYLTFFSFLGSSLIGYFINYKQVLLSADQRNYVVAAYSQSANVVKILLQMGLAYYTGNYYLWVVVEFLFGILYSIILNWKIKQVYPWLVTEVKKGKALCKEYPDVMKYTKQLFIHKIGSVAYTQVTPFLVYAFASLQAVAYYGNYTLITSKLSSLLGNFLGGTNASVGNLIAEGDKNKILKVYWELMSIRFLFVGVAVFAMYHLLPPFIALWLGKEYVMSQTLLIIVLITFALGIIRGVTEEFLIGYGLFSDVWSPFVEAAILIIVAISGGNLWGLEGTLLGSVVSNIIIIYIWKPYFLFTRGLKISVKVYWIELVKYILSVSISFYITYALLQLVYLQFNIFSSWIDWIIYAVILTLMLTFVIGSVLLLITKGARNLCLRLMRK
ncbi:MAG: sugar transporter [Bacteroidaceae bacterium]|nr:sugar transporter [Bacteroidaceae bacterium]